MGADSLRIVITQRSMSTRQDLNRPCQSVSLRRGQEQMNDRQLPFQPAMKAVQVGGGGCDRRLIASVPFVPAKK